MLKTIYLCIYVTIVFILNSLNVFSQDNNISRNEIYPSQAFMAPQGLGRMLDVTKLTTYKLPDGYQFKNNADVKDNSFDDSKAINEFLNWLANRRRVQLGIPGEARCVFYESWILYFPNGVYNLKAPVAYSGDIVPDCAGVTYTNQNDLVREGMAGIKLFGQSRENVILKLLPDALGFNNINNPKPVVSFSHELATFNNAPAAFQFRNFIIQTQDHAGAVGLNFFGANNARIDNVKIIGSPKAVSGLDITKASAHGYYSNITIEGFQHGIRIDGINGSSIPVLEYITLKNQSVSTITNYGCAATLRKIKSENECPAIVMGVRKSPVLAAGEFMKPTVVLIDSYFKNLNNKSESTAFTVNDGYLFLRNIRAENFNTILKQGNAFIKNISNPIVEYRSHDFLFHPGRVRPAAIKSLNLKIEEVPDVKWQADFTKWIMVPGGADNEKSAINDDGPAIQKMIDGLKGKGYVLYFPKNYYRIEKPIKISPAVSQLIGMDTHTTSARGDDETAEYAFNIEESSDEILLINGILFNGNGVYQTKKRTVFFEGSRSRSDLYLYQNNSSAPNLVFINNGNKFSVKPLVNVTAYARFIDNEQRSTVGQFNVKGPSSSLWILGCKTEPPVNTFHAADGAKLEVLGGLGNRTRHGRTGDNPLVLNDNANVSVIFSVNGFGNFWEPLVRDIQGKKIFEIDSTAAKQKVIPRGYGGNFLVPMYVSYTP